MQKVSGKDVVLFFIELAKSFKMSEISSYSDTGNEHKIQTLQPHLVWIFQKLR